jgi:hypothetical protein
MQLYEAINIMRTMAGSYNESSREAWELVEAELLRRAREIDRLEGESAQALAAMRELQSQMGPG